MVPAKFMHPWLKLLSVLLGLRQLLYKVITGVERISTRHMCVQYDVANANANVVQYNVIPRHEMRYDVMQM